MVHRLGVPVRQVYRYTGSRIRDTLLLIRRTPVPVRLSVSVRRSHTGTPERIRTPAAYQYTATYGYALCILIRGGVPVRWGSVAVYAKTLQVSNDCVLRMRVKLGEPLQKMRLR